MAEWISSWANQAIQFADGIADSIVAQANAAQSEIEAEQKRIRQEETQKKPNELTSLPWETNDETKTILSNDLMERILRLPFAEKNFLVGPPDPELIPFNLTEFVPIAMKMLAIDTNLARIHAKLAPKMNEEIFWRNYHFRIMYLRAKVGIVDDIRFDFRKLPENEIIFEGEAPQLPISHPVSESEAVIVDKSAPDKKAAPTASLRGAAEPGPPGGASNSAATANAKKSLSPAAVGHIKPVAPSSSSVASAASSDSDFPSNNAAAKTAAPLAPSSPPKKPQMTEAQRKKAEEALALEVERELDAELGDLNFADGELDLDIDLNDLGDLNLDDVDGFEDLGDLDMDDLGDLDDI